MFTSNFLLKNATIRYVRGESNVTQSAKTNTIASGSTRISSFWGVCGSLLSQASSGFPGTLALRIGLVDDFEMHETVLKPRIERSAAKRVKWLKPADGMEQQEGDCYSQQVYGSDGQEAW